MKIESWIKKIESAKKKLKEKHGSKAKESEDHYYNDESRKIAFPIYWSSIQVIRSALYSKPPKPEIRTRIKGNPQAKEISKTLEQAITYEIDKRDFYGDTKRAVLDYLLTDLGVLRVRYDVKTVPQRDGTGSVVMGENGEPMMAIGNQSVYVDHWAWNRFLWDIGKDWDECDWICYIHHMTTSEIEQKYNTTISKMDLSDSGDAKGKATVYEIWDKKERKIYEIMTGKNKPLRVRNDPLKLMGFFDCPKPMISNMRTDKYIPQTEYTQIERQLKNINTLELRIDALTKNIRDVGFYESSVKDLNKLETVQDGKLVPISGLRELLDGSTGFDNVIAKLPIVQQAQVVQQLQQQKENQKNQLYEITGLSDIIRGSTKASETATAQQIKGQWANVRLLEKQTTINACWRSIMRMFAEIIGEHFTAEQLTLMTGNEISEELKQIMSSDLARCYAIDVETDSTIQADESQEKADRLEMVNTMLNLLNTILPAVQQQILPADIAKELSLTAVRGFKHARSLEDMISSMDGTAERMQGLQQQLQQMQQESQQLQQETQQQMQLVQEQAQQAVQQSQEQIQQLSEQLQQVNEREESRKDAEVQSEALKDKAQAEKEIAQAEKLRAEAAQINSEIKINSMADLLEQHLEDDMPEIAADVY